MSTMTETTPAETPPPASLLTTEAAAPPAPAKVEAPSAVITDSSKIPDWKTTLPDEIRNDNSLKHITDIASLAKSYVHAQRLVGTDKVALPSKHATDDDWSNFFTKIGKPKEIDQYEVKADEKLVPKETLSAFKEVAFKSNLLPKQAQAVLDWYKGHSEKTIQDMNAKSEAEQQTEIHTLKQEWGGAFDAKLARAQLVIKEHADDETIKYLVDSGLGNNTKLIRLLAKVGEMYSEDKIRGEGADANALSPEDAMKQAQEIMMNTGHPYNIKSHPNHKAAVDEVNKYFQMAYPSRR